MPLTSSARWRAGLVPILVVLAAVLLAAGLLVGRAHMSAPRRPATTPGPASVQGPTLRPVTITGPDGSTVTCPSGARPAVALESVRFDPSLSGGTRLLRRTYHVLARGSVVNETNMPIVIDRLRVSVGGRRWPAVVRRPAAVPAQAKEPLLVRGTYVNARSARARLTTRLSWHWKDPRLRGCRSRGLVDDD